MKVSLISMGKIKKRNARESIIAILSRKFPLNIKKIYNAVKKEYNLDLTYQAIFKLVKEMHEDGLLEKEGMEYRLNIGWIKQLEDELKIIKYNYCSLSSDSSDLSDVFDISNRFVSAIGPEIKNYIGSDKACVIALKGRFYGLALWKYLVREGIDCKYTEFVPIEEALKKKISVKKEDVEGRKVIVVDSAIFSGKTYEIVMKKLNKFKKALKIKEIKYVVDRDIAGLADFSRTRVDKT